MLILMHYLLPHFSFSWGDSNNLHKKLLLCEFSIEQSDCALIKWVTHSAVPEIMEESIPIYCWCTFIKPCSLPVYYPPFSLEVMSTRSDLQWTFISCRMLGHLYCRSFSDLVLRQQTAVHEQLGGLAYIAIIEIQQYVMEGLKLTP